MRTPKASSIFYMLRNAVFLLPLTILPAVLLAFSQTPVINFTQVDFFVKFAQNLDAFEIKNFTIDLYRYFTSINTSNLWWLWLFGVIALFISFSLTLPYIERHMRLGVRSYSRLLSMLNESVLLMLPYLICVLAAYEVVSLIICGMIYLFFLMGMGGLTLFGLSIVVALLLYIVFFMLFALTICSVPSMLCDGYKFNVAISYSARLVSTHFGKVLAQLFVPMALSFVLLGASRYLMAVLPLYTELTHLLVSFLFYLFWVNYLPVYAMRDYTLLTEGVRKDLKVKLF